MAGVWGAGASMVVEPGVLGPVALIPRPHSYSCMNGEVPIRDKPFGELFSRMVNPFANAQILFANGEASHP